MTNIRFRVLLVVGILCLVVAVFAVGFVVGGVSASTEAARSANAASLIYFTGIHEALDRQKYEQASKITNTAVDGHIGVLRLLNAHPWSAAWYYVLSWGRTQEAWITSAGLAKVRKSYAAEPDQLQPETRDFVDASR